jgi:signal peptidase I
MGKIMKAETKKLVIKEIISWVKIAIFAISFALIFNHFIIVNAQIPSPSMEQTIRTRDRVVALRFSYLFSNPKRYDMIVFRFPDDTSQLFVKRIIGMPGEKVTVQNGKVYINDDPTPLIDEFTQGFQDDRGDGIYYVPNDSYFVLGDNRNASSDSRHWKNSFVTRKNILGKVAFRYFPNPRIYTNNYN